MLTTDSLTKAGQWLDPDAGEQGPTIVYTDAAAELVAEGGIMSRRLAVLSSPLCWPNDTDVPAPRRKKIRSGVLNAT